MVTIHDSKVNNSLASASFGNRRLDSRDLENPASKKIVQSLSSLRDRVLNSADHTLQTQLKEYAGRNIIIKHSESEGIEVSVEGRLGTAPKKIFSSKTLLTFDSSINEASNLATAKGIGDVAPDLVGQLQANNAHPALIWLISTLNKAGNYYLVKLLMELFNVNAFSADFLSMGRNSTNALTGGKAESLLLMTRMGGIMAVITGAYFTLKALLDIFICAGLGDAKGAGMNVLMLIAFLGYIGMGLGMLGLIQGFEAPVGLVFYVFNGLCTGYQLMEDCLFRANLNQRFKSIETKDLAATLEWMKEEVKKQPKDFARATSGGAARRVSNEVTDLLISAVRRNDTEAKAQALHLIEEVSKANYGNIYAGICSMVITALGIIANVLEGGGEWVIPLCFAIGATLWLIVGDLKLDWVLHFNMKEWVAGKLWSIHQKSDFWKSFNALKQTLDQELTSKAQSTTSSPTSVLNGDLQATA